MSWHAFDAVDDAVEATRGFLRPVTLSRWWRLVVMALFLGGFGSVGNAGSNAPSFVPADAPGGGGAELSPEAAGTVVVAVFALVALLVLALVVLQEPVRFAYLDALADDDVRLGRVATRFWTGLRLLIFRILAWLLTGALLAAVVVGVALIAGLSVESTGVDGVPAAGIGVAAGLAIVAVLFGTLLVASVVLHFTTAFVAPTMVATDRGVLAAWGRFWGVLTDQPGQFLLYLVVRLFLNIGVGIALGIVTAVLAGIVLLGGGVVVGGIVVLAGGLSAVTESLAVAVVVGVAAAVTLFVLLFGVVLPVRVVGLTFTTTYALSVLGRADPDLAILADYGDGGDDPDRLAERFPEEGSDGEDGDGPADGDDVGPGRETDPDRDDFEFGDDDRR